MDDLLEQFLIESRELVVAANDDLAVLDRNPADAARIDSALRALHTLKGSAAIFALSPMSAVLHAAEDVLSAANRNGAIDPSAVSVLIECIDQTDRWIDDVEASGSLPDDAARASLRLVRTLSEGTGRETPPATAIPDWATPLLDREAHGLPLDEPLVAVRYVPDTDCFFRGDDPLATIAAIPALVSVVVSPRSPWRPLETFDPFACNLVIQAVSRATYAEVQGALRLVPDQAELAALTAPSAETGDRTALPGPDAASRTLRVDAGRIDRLLSMVGELSVAKNRLIHLADHAKDGASLDQVIRDLRAEHAIFERLTNDLHATVMGIRTVPLQRVFGRLPRQVRETAERLGRQIDFQMRGETTELDKGVVDALFEPLLHLIRNAIDHGIEPPEARKAAGKALQGRITLEARRAGDQVEIEIADDGAGIDPKTIRRVAVERGLLTSDAAGELNDAEAIDLIFAPGFSTASEVSEISGRGVGMDAVRVAVSRLGGRIEVGSRLGAGTRIRVFLPLNAVLTGIVAVQVGEERFGIPMEDIVEVVRVPTDRIRPIGQGAAFVLRDRTVPYLQLGELLGRARPDTTGNRPVLIAHAGADQVGVAVDAVASRFTALLQPATGLLEGLPGVTGTTLLGDGSVLLVLDLEELIG